MDACRVESCLLDGTLVWRKGPLQEEERKMTLVLDLDETLVHALEIPDHVDPMYLEEYIAQKNGGTYVPADLRIVISNRRNSLDCDGSSLGAIAYWKMLGDSTIIWNCSLLIQVARSGTPSRALTSC